MNPIDRIVSYFAPRWGLARERARQQATIMRRHFEAAAIGRRTAHWNKSGADPNVALSGAIGVLRALSRDLARNNPWARRGISVIGHNTIGWGIIPKAVGAQADRVNEAWKKWGETTECDADGRNTFYGLQKQVLRSVVEAGEVLVRMRPRRPDDGLTVPMQLQVIEADLIDSTRDNMKGIQGGQVIQGIEFDAIGRRVAYWLYDQHPGSNLSNGQSRRIPADGIQHIFVQDRPGQVRGVPWLAPVIVRLRDFDEYEDATLMRQKVAALFAAFVTDSEASGLPLAEGDTDQRTGLPVDTIEPGEVIYLPPGKEVSFGTPPSTSDHPSFSMSQLRAIASGLGTTYEDLTGDYSQSNFSSSRMARVAHWANVHDWRWNLIIPQFCQPAFEWFVEALILGNVDVKPDVAEERPRWTPPPAPMVDPDKEGLALMRMVRTGAMTHDQMIREQGFDPDDHWQEYADGLKRLDRLKILLDSDPRNLSQNGVMQPAPEPPPIESKAPPGTNGKPPGATEKPAGVPPKKPAVAEQPAEA